MENSKESSAGEKPAEPNPNPNPSAVNSDDSAAVAAAAEIAAPTRRPFTALSQVDADLALARVLQEQASDLLPSPLFLFACLFPLNKFFPLYILFKHSINQKLTRNVKNESLTTN